MRTGYTKLIRFCKTSREELRDLGSDISEQKDLAAIGLPARRRIGARLDALLVEVGMQMPVPT